MNESRWEASRRNARKSGIVIFLVFVAVSVVAGILFINNRDLIDDAPRSDSAAIEKDTAQAVEAERADDHAADTGTVHSGDGGDDAATPTIDTVHRDSSRKLSFFAPVAAPAPEVIPTAKAKAVRHQPAAVNPPSAQSTPESKISQAPSSHRPASIKLPPFDCRVDSRKDVVIYLSLELFFEDAEKRSSLLLRREDIKVMVMRTLRGKLLGEIATGKLEEELRGAINELFDHGEIVAVKISDIRIEKAVKE